MSLESWKAEFYPVPAADCPKEEAIAHSLRKWRGLRPEALKRHDVLISINRHVVDEEARYIFFVSAATCALCAHYYDEAKEELACDTCPLAKSLGAPCDRDRGDTTSPWWAWGDLNPEPMIAALEKAQADAEVSHAS